MNIFPVTTKKKKKHTFFLFELADVTHPAKQRSHISLSQSPPQQQPRHCQSLSSCSKKHTGVVADKWTVKDSFCSATSLTVLTDANVLLWHHNALKFYWDILGSLPLSQLEQTPLTCLMSSEHLTQSCQIMDLMVFSANRPASWSDKADAGGAADEVPWGAEVGEMLLLWLGQAELLTRYCAAIWFLFFVFFFFGYREDVHPVKQPPSETPN